MDLANYFGIDVEAQITDWFDGEFTEEFRRRFSGRDIGFFVLDNDRRSEWDSEIPGVHTLLTLFTGDEDVAFADDGVIDNVNHKLRFVLRTGLNSVEAEKAFRYLVQPGDFPWEGAGTYRSFTGGVSGLLKEDDWRVFCQIIDKLIELLDAVAEKAQSICEIERKKDDAPVGTKYLQVTVPQPDTTAV